MLKYRAPKHKMNPEQDYAKLRSIAMQKRQMELYQTRREELRKQVFWKIKV
jgi:hypothetical protein